MKLIILSGKISWFGKESGYDVLTDYISVGNDVRILQSGYSFFGKLIGKIFQRIFKWGWVNTQDVYTDLRFILGIAPKRVSHILHVESHIQIIEKIKQKKENVVGTIHLPYSQWQKEWLVSLQKFNHAIILYEKELEIFSKYLPTDHLYFIRHGVNINFFKPGPSENIKKNKVLIVGHYLRNFNMLLHVYKSISEIWKNYIEFHIVIPELYRNIEVLQTLKENGNVFFYQNLSDQELLEQYQTSYLLLIPMNDSGANSAIVQALAVGLPVVTTDVGGIRSYGGGEIYPVVENNNTNEMVALFTKYYKEDGFRDTISTKTRKYAEEYLDWNFIAKQHLSIYQSIQNNTP